MTLIDLLNHLPPGAKLSTTPEIEKRGHTLKDGSIFQARGLVIDLGYEEKEAELSPDGTTIKVYAGGLWVPWPIFTVQQNTSDLEDTYGPAAPFSEHKRGQRIKYQADGLTYTGIISWVCCARDLPGGQHIGINYVVFPDAAERFID